MKSIFIFIGIIVCCSFAL